MRDETLKTYLKQLIHIHMPTYFMNCDYLEMILDALCVNPAMSRRETLILAYSVGANQQEADTLLEVNGHAPLCVKKYEDAIWCYFLKSNSDITEIMNKIFD